MKNVKTPKPLLILYFIAIAGEFLLHFIHIYIPKFFYWSVIVVITIFIIRRNKWHNTKAERRSLAFGTIIFMIISILVSQIYFWVFYGFYFVELFRIFIVSIFSIQTTLTTILIFEAIYNADNKIFMYFDKLEARYYPSNKRITRKDKRAPKKTEKPGESGDSESYSNLRDNKFKF